MVKYTITFGRLIRKTRSMKQVILKQMKEFKVAIKGRSNGYREYPTPASPTILIAIPADRPARSQASSEERRAQPSMR